MVTHKIMQLIVSMPVVTGAAITQISSDTLYVSLGLVISVVAAAFYIGAKLREIDINQKNTHYHQKETNKRLEKIEERLDSLPCPSCER